MVECVTGSQGNKFVLAASDSQYLDVSYEQIAGFWVELQFQRYFLLRASLKKYWPLQSLTFLVCGE
jgi:hypothetical protein